MPDMTALRSRRSADRAHLRAGSAIPQLSVRSVRNPYPPMQLLSADQIEAIHEASMHILENFGIEVMSSRALSLFEQTGAAVEHATHTVRLDRGLVAEKLQTTRPRYRLTPRNPDKAVDKGSMEKSTHNAPLKPSDANGSAGAKPAAAQNAAPNAATSTTTGQGSAAGAANYRP